MNEKTPFFRELFHLIERFDDPLEIWREILSKWLHGNAGAVCAPENFKSRETSTFLGERPEALYNLYALSRISQLLTLPFQKTDNQAYVGPEISIDQYLEFFESLGMRPISQCYFSPFHHEIVRIIESDEVQEPEIVRELWPELVYGQMLFSRAGVIVRCNPRNFNKDLVERSRLYFAYRRLSRECDDTSQGWGHNSQWNTAFHRNYEEPDAYYYNVDGEWIIGKEKSSKRVNWRPREEELSSDQRIELIRYRCWISKDHGERFPFWDQYIEPKDCPASRA
jgi:hypothetical protein